MQSPAPLFNSAVFNNAAFQFTNYLTKNQADQLYISLYLLPGTFGAATANKLMITDASNSIQTINQIGFNSMNYNGTVITATGTEINYLHGSVPGTVSASNVVIVDSSKNISGFNDITTNGEIFMQGNAKDIHINGIGSKVNFSGLGSGIIMSSLTSSITMNSTLSNSISTAGGISVGSVLFGATQAAYLTSITPGTASASKALIFDSSLNITGINNLSLTGITSSLTISGTNSSLNLTGASSKLAISNTSQSTSSSTGAIQCAGGIYAGANSLFAGNISLSGSLLITGAIAFQSTNGLNMNSNSISNCTTFGSSGIMSLLNTTASTSFSTGALLLSGAIGISNSTDASSYTNGGSITTAGGVAIAKKLYVGSDLNVGGNLSISGTLTSQILALISDTGIANLVYPLVITHLLSSGTPTNNAFGIGMLFNGPNSINSTITYGRIYSTIQSSTSGSHKGSLTFSSVFNAGFVDGFTLSSSGASTSSLTMLGTGTIIATTLTGTLSTAAQPNITSLGTLTSLVLSGSISGCTTFDSTGNMNINSTFRVIGAANPVSGSGCEINFTSTTSNIYSFNRSLSIYYDLNLNDNMLISSTGIISISGTTTSTSNSTGILTLAGGIGISNTTDATSSTNGGTFTSAGGGAFAKTLQVGGTLNIGNPVFGLGNGVLNVKSLSYQLCLLNSSTYFTRFATNASGTLQIELNTAGGSGGASTIFIAYSSASLSTLGLSGVVARNGSIIDMGNTATDTSLILFQSGGGSIFGMGANNSATEFHTGGNFTFYNGTTANGSLGTLQASLYNGGSFQTQGHLRATGFSATGMTAVSGAEIFWDGSYGQFISYSRATFLYKDCIFGGNCIYTSGSTANVGLKGPNVNGYPLEIPANAHTISTSYGYLTSGGSVGTSSSSGSQNYSLYCSGRILCTNEIDVLSDIRIKQNIVDITNEEAEIFIKKVIPKRYSLKANPTQSEYGYIAQDVAKAELNHHTNLNSLITQHNEKDLEEMTDEDGFTSPADVSLAINYIKIIPLLHQYILMQDERIKKNEETIAELKEGLRDAMDWQFDHNVNKANKLLKSFNEKPEEVKIEPVKAPSTIIKIKKKKRVILN